MAPTLRSRKPVVPMTNVPVKKPRPIALVKPKLLSARAPAKTATTAKKRGIPDRSQTEDESELMAMARDENEGIMITSTPMPGSRRKHQVKGKAKAKILLPKTVVPNIPLEDSISDIEPPTPVSKRPRRQDSQREDVQAEPEPPARRSRRSTRANPQPEEPIVARSTSVSVSRGRGGQHQSRETGSARTRSRTPIIPEKIRLEETKNTRRPRKPAVPVGNPIPEKIVLEEARNSRRTRKPDVPVENIIPQRTTKVKAPHTRRSKKTAVPVPVVIPETTTLEKARNLLCGTCKLFRAGQLYNLEDVTEIALAKLKRKLVKYLRDSLGSDNNKYEFDAKFSIITDLPKSGNDPDSLYIEVTRNHLDRPNRKKPIFLGLFTSCGSVALRYIYQTSENGVRDLPIFIANSRDKYMKVVKQALTKLFSCPFLAYELGWHDMTYMAGSWMLLRGRHEGDTMKLVCKDIKPLVEISTFHSEFNVTLNMEAWNRKWAILSTGQTKEVIEDKDIHLFWRTLAHTNKTLGSIELNRVHVNKIMLPEMVFTSDGKIKAAIKDMTTVTAVLANLTRIFEHFAIPKESEQHEEL